MVKRIYISGPMTGLPENNYTAFHAAERALTEHGHDVINPARPAPSDWTWLDFMRRAVRDLSTADAVATLPGWPQSRGARAEVDLARGLGLDVREVEAW